MEQPKKCLSVKRPCETLEQQEKSLSLKWPCDKSANATSDSKKGKENNEREDRFSFDVTIDDLAQFKEDETPVNTKEYGMGMPKLRGVASCSKREVS